MLILLAATAVLTLALPASAQEKSDSTRRSENRIETAFKIYPSPIWGKTAGFAAGVGYEIDNLFFPDSRILATAVPGQHLGRYTLTYFAADAFKSPVYGLANLYYETTGHQWYYGLGPASSRDDLVAVEKHMVEAEVRAGVQPFDRRFFVQPVAKYVRHDVEGFKSERSGAVGRLSAESLENLVLSTERVFEGMGYGVAAGIDLRDNPIRSTKGLYLQGFATRYDFSEPSGLLYGQFGASAHAFLPFRDNTFAIRAVMLLTRNEGEVDIPFFLLPSLHGRMLPGYSWDRFFANDLFALQLEYVVPVFDVFNWAALDAIISAGAAGVYDDLFDQFKPALSFDRELEPGRETYPLRPSAAIGFQIDSFSRHDFNLRVLLGWGTEGVRVVRFGFVQDLRDIELSYR
ncbi:MAG: hypothetical protein WD275_05505 [Rhodothermales bacterium]